LAADLPVGLFDPSNSLKPLLATVSVDTIDLREAGLDHFHGRLAILGPFKSETEIREGFARYVRDLALKGAAVVWLIPPGSFRESFKPSFWILREGPGAIVLAQSALVANLSENPESQLTLVKLSRLATHPELFRFPGLVAAQ
jgi:hypothetical protein